MLQRTNHHFDTIRNLTIAMAKSTSLAFDGENLLVVGRDTDSLSAIDPYTGAVKQRWQLISKTHGLGFDGHTLWMSHHQHRTLKGFDPKTLEIIEQRTLPDIIELPGDIACDRAFFYQVDIVGGNIVCLDKSTLAVKDVIGLDRVVSGIAVHRHFLIYSEAALSRVGVFNMRERKIVETFHVAGTPTGVAVQLDPTLTLPISVWYADIEMGQVSQVTTPVIN